VLGSDTGVAVAASGIAAALSRHTRCHQHGLFYICRALKYHFLLQERRGSASLLVKLSASNRRH